MYILVCSNNLFLIFVGWEGVGICSYLLINFWYFRIQANKSSILAVTVNKVGDLAFLIAISIIQFFSKTTDLLIFNNLTLFLDNWIRSSSGLDAYLLSITSAVTLINTATIFFIIACVGKSAQFGLHLWLPEAMEGPTPVSSLIHAATMVTAGLYLILRVSFLFKFAPTSLLIILLIGSFTTIFAASIGLVQVDIKKIVAYSTCSQLGYMFMGCGYKGYQFVIFHLFIHAFFKALLFLTAGYLIHLLLNEQDTRKMGGLLKISQFSYVAMSIGSFALIGFPFFSGFYSKEKILEELSSTILSYDYGNYDTLFFIASLFSYSTLILTILYSFKVLSEIFFGKFNGFKKAVGLISYSEYFIISPLFLLSMLSIYSGYFFYDAMVGISTDFWANSFFVEDRIFRNYTLFNTDYSVTFDYTLWKAHWFRTQFSFDYVLRSYYPYIFPDIKIDNSMGYRMMFQDELISPIPNYDLLYTNLISEFEWKHTQWIVPTWTFYYLFCICFFRFFFFFEIKQYLYELVISKQVLSSFFTSLVKKYVYFNRLLIVPLVYSSYKVGYNFFYFLIEKGLLEQFGGYGISNTFKSIFYFQIKKRTFLLYHYLGLMIISLIILFFYIVHYTTY
jgi:NADH:ubiquinone oxidoreductase subunit 5 (subunit L)/multisubunit Na+/H+ antiporter MnhA subunit